MPISTERRHREEIVRFGRLLYERGFIAAMDGNISVRLDDERFLITPTCMCKGTMTPEDLVIVDNQGRKLEGEREVSSELAMHVLIYGMRPDVRGIVHAHPPTATGFAAAGIALDQPLISEVVITLGAVPLAGYATPGTSELCTTLEPWVPEHYAILMANHGVVAYGASLDQAFMNMETVEHFAKISLVTRTLGQQNVLGPEDVRKLEQIRRKIEKSRANHNGNGNRIHAEKLA